MSEPYMIRHGDFAHTPTFVCPICTGEAADRVGEPQAGLGAGDAHDERLAKYGHTLDRANVAHVVRCIDRAQTALIAAVEALRLGEGTQAEAVEERPGIVQEPEGRIMGVEHGPWPTLGGAQ